MRFRDRREASQQLARALEKYLDQPIVVYALSQGGVILGAEIAKRLSAPLDLVIPRKIGHPFSADYAICAVTGDGHVICDQAEAKHLDAEWLSRAVKAEQAEAIRRRKRYLAGRTPVSATGKTAIITDDGISTSLTIQAAIMEVKTRRPAKIVLAVPVVSESMATELARQVDEIVALDIPAIYMDSVGAYYDKFDQVKDKEVIALISNLRVLGY